MLLELRIRDFAIIEEAALQFGPGLNVLSGETGAGKTIIMSALAMLLGARASAELIRVDRKEAAVEARFDLAGDTEFPRDAEQLHRGGDQPGGDQGEMLVRRVIAEGGRSRVLINDELATVNSLAKIGDALVQIYGQHEQQSLLRPETHRQILDRYAGLESELAEYGAAYERAAAIRARVDELSPPRTRARRFDRAGALQAGANSSARRFRPPKMRSLPPRAPCSPTRPNSPPPPTRLRSCSMERRTQRSIWSRARRPGSARRLRSIPSSARKSS